MYSKEELLSKEVSELEDIAKTLGAEIPSKNTEDLVYSILDQQAIEEGSKNPLGQRKRRTRIAKKDTDRVYTVNGKEGENFDLKNNKLTTTEQPSLFKDDAPAGDETAKPKKRGRKSKKEKEAEAAALAAQEAAKNAEMTAVSTDTPAAAVDQFASNDETRAEILPPSGEADSLSALPAKAVGAQERPVEATAETEEPLPTEMTGDTEDLSVPEASFLQQSPTDSLPEGNEDDSLIAQLQAKINAHNVDAGEGKSSTAGKGIWEGDPGDGTDFITVVDLPIEDQGALPNYDIFDNPTNGIPPVESQQRLHLSKETTEKYSFEDLIPVDGVLEIMPDNYGFIRSSDYNYLSSPDDVYIPMPQIKKYGLKTGDVIQGKVRPPHEGEKYFLLTSIEKINGRLPADMRDRIPFEHLTPLFPDEKFSLCNNPATTNLSTRIVDLFSPIGKGQRALIVAQPKTGKTILMKNIANAIAANHPEAYLMMLLIDERPEEVTDMARTVNAEVIASTFDEPAERHVKIAGIVLEKAKRLVESGHDVVIFLDSITRLARAYNTVSPASGKILTGGVDANALQKPKRFFGAARNVEGGGSLTIIATALIDTGSKMDEVIFEEFKGTGNMELQLDRSLSNKRIFPAVNLVASSTRRDDLLHDKTTLDRMWVLRKYISDMNPIEAMNVIHDRLGRTKDNDEFLLSMNS